MHSSSKSRLMLPSLLATSVMALSGQSLASDTIGQALFDDAKVKFNFRLRTEDVAVEGSTDRDLSSLKSRLTYSSGQYQGFSSVVEIDNVTHISDDEGGIADPDGTEINQAYLAWSGSDTTIKYGRQRILLDNQRFVGGVGFRQNEQTYDGFSVKNTSLTDTTVFIANVYNVNRIFGEDSPIGDHKNNTWMLNAKYTGLEAGTLTAYSYLIDNKKAAVYSSDTYGARFAGKTGALGYTFELASQSDAANNPKSYSANYYLAEGVYTFDKVKLKAGYEVLGADGSDGQFVTPLATLHKFQGWDDKFLGGGTGNILGGIEDFYLSASGKVGPVSVSAVYHQLSSNDSAASGMDDLGSEIGASFGGKVGPVKLSLKVSRYQANDFSADTTKMWLTAAAAF